MSVGGNTLQELFERTNFQVLSDQVHLPFSTPSISEYESRKQIRVVTGNDEVCLSHFRCACFYPTDGFEADGDHFLSRGWSAFFGRRIHAASIGGAMRIAAYFPGHTVPGLGNGRDKHALRYRGSLLFEQYLELVSLVGGQPATSGGKRIRTHAITPEGVWPWTAVSRPNLSYIESYIEIEADSNMAETARDAGDVIRELRQKARVFASSPKRPVSEMLSAVHAAWTDTPPPRYSAQAVELCEKVWHEKRQRTREENLLPLLFELEGFAGFLTYSQKIKLFASGIFANNWLEVGLLPLADCRGTELCVRERLIDEVINLTRRGFAPLVVNEYGSVADGNHRLTASWIWNILNACANYDWSLSCPEFQERVGEFVATHSSSMGDVTIHESLLHLGAYLGDEATRERLIRELKPAVGQHLAVSEVPVVLLPEYFSGAVVKAPYDDGHAGVRVEPSLFAAMAATPGSVLPPRASYHFTDCAPLPWFSILVPITSFKPVPAAEPRRSFRHHERTLTLAGAIHSRV